MNKKNQRHDNRVRNLVGISALSAIVLLVATFAWFIGMQTVTVTSFDIEVAVVDGLMLSLDGKKWDTTVTINESNFDEDSYTGNTNSWGGANGLIPMSSVGEIDLDVSRMKLFEKASHTPVPATGAGGFRLISSRVDNYSSGKGEENGYVAFDLFVKNTGSTAYIEDANLLDEEAIYLVTGRDEGVDPLQGSKVTVADVGGEAGTGIENAIRVAFAQIGRVIGTETDQNKITSITCNKSEVVQDPDGEPGEMIGGLPSVADGITGICRTAQIWEPNDKAHVSSAIGYYNTNCLERTGEDVYAAASYTTNACGVVADENAYDTYAVQEPIAITDNVNVYDGTDYNGYTATITNNKLKAYPYFTDTHRDKEGVARPAFMTLAPNSITKVRVYVFLEGQDIDNYDLSFIGKRISVQFGFTKQRMTGEDFDYDGPEFNRDDKIKPVITLTGSETIEVDVDGEFNDPGATALDDVDGDITYKIQVINPVNTAVAGTYYVAYDVSDWAGNRAVRVYRTVIVS